jgi:hypothetical protein
MRLTKLPYDTSALVEFYQQGLESLGALCERTWFDRLQVVAEGRAAKVWEPAGELLEVEVRFPPPDQTGSRDAAKEVFPGCPLTFRLADALCPVPLVFHRVALQMPESPKVPPGDVAEKLWRTQYPDTFRWQLETPFQPSWRFSLLALARCEIQAIDQHWSLHRLTLSLPDGEPDEALAQQLAFCGVAPEPAQPIPWPAPDPAAWPPLLRDVLLRELENDLAAIRQRQETYLRRELDRIDDYFAGYERELRERLERQQRDEAKVKLEQRLAAAKTEHQHRRKDQVQRHEIRVLPHLDALLLLAEPAWQATVTSGPRDATFTQPAQYLPRARRWTLLRPG